MQQLFNVFSSKAVKANALENGYFRKRSHDAKLEWCEEFLTDEVGEWVVEPIELLRWLDDNPPLSIQQKQKADVSSQNIYPYAW